MSNYYEHEDEVRFTEGYMELSKDWQWFIDLTESSFSPSIAIESFADFEKRFSEVSCFYDHACALVSRGLDESIACAEEWTARTHRSARICAGKIPFLGESSSSAFFDLLDIVACATWMLNRLSDAHLVYSLEPFTMRNLGQLYAFDELSNECANLLNALSRIRLTGIDGPLGVARDNFDMKIVSCNTPVVLDFLAGHFDADYLSFRAPDAHSCGTWQESFLFDMVNTSIKDGGLQPALVIGGRTIPNLERWTPKVLDTMRSSFDDERAICIVDSIDYLLHKAIPSDRSLYIIAKECVQRVGEIAAGSFGPYGLRCTVLKMAALLFREDKRNRAIKDFLAMVGKSLAGLSDVASLRAIESLPLPLNKAPKEAMRDEERGRSRRIYKIATAHDLLECLRDEGIRRHCDEAGAKEMMNRFSLIVNQETGLWPTLFIEAMNFVVGLLNNAAIDKSWIACMAMELKHNWTDAFYRRSVSQMHVVASTIEQPASEVETIREEALWHPIQTAKSLFRVDDEAISRVLVEIGNSPLTVTFEHIDVNEAYPYVVRFVHNRTHDVDDMIYRDVDMVNTKYAFRQLNHFETSKVIPGFYEDFRFRFTVFISLLGPVEKMYAAIRAMSLHCYDLLDYPFGSVKLAHVTQLFPLLENAIREVGEYYLVPSFKLETDGMGTLKDAPGVLSDIIKKTFDVTNTLDGVGDLILVYYVMFNKNGFNVRNSCVHGQLYQSGGRVDEAFRMTVFCTYVILWRLDFLRMGENDTGKGSLIW